MKRLAFLLLAACADPQPVVTFALDVPDPALDADLDRAIMGWARIGLVRDDANPDIAAVRVERVPDDSIQAEGVTFQLERRIAIRESLERSDRFFVILAHEVGHAVLATGRHTTCGIMASDDTFPCAEDAALACERVGVGCL